MAPQTLTRQLGKDGPRIPAVGFGLMGMSIGYGAADSDEERLKVLDRAWELGCTNWDTADAYGDSEDLIGKWFKLHPERRADIFLATKFGLKGNADGSIGVDSSPDYARQCLERSLQRLGVASVDLYYVHRADPAVPIEKTVAVLKEFVQEGKIKYLGLSEASSTTLRRAHAIHPIHAVQAEYNPWTLEIEDASGTHLLATCRELGVSVIAYAPLGRGIMTGRFRSAADFEAGDARAHLTRYQGAHFQKNLELVDKFAALAERKGCTAGQLVLAWLVAQGGDGDGAGAGAGDEVGVFVIPGTKKIPYLEENFGASAVVISEAEEKEIRALVEEAGVSGDRSAMFGAFVDTAPLDT